MEQNHDRPLAATCAKGTLLGALRTGGLIMGMLLAGILLVDLPIPTGGAADPHPYVPASETWIDLEPDTGPDTSVSGETTGQEAGEVKS